MRSFMDELSLLEAVSSEDVAAAEAAVAPETALPPVQRPDFTGSLDFIDSLASRSALAISQRDLFKIATAVNLATSKYADQEDVLIGSLDPYSISTDFRPLGDARRFNPEGATAPVGLSRSSTSVVSPSRVRSEFPPDFVNPLDPSRDVNDLNRTFNDIERRISRKPFAFCRPSQVVTCFKRKIRRQVMASLNFPLRPWPLARRRTNAFSRVIC